MLTFCAKPFARTIATNATPQAQRPALRSSFTSPLLSALSLFVPARPVARLQLLVTLQILLAKTDSQLKVLTVNAAISADLARADAEHTFPNRRFLQLEDIRPTARILHQCTLDECGAPARYTLHAFTSHKDRASQIL